MGLLAPLFAIAGILALAVPILVHLIHRERSETVPFPSLMFLRRIPYRSVRRQKIRHWLLFLLRSLALVLLASAFARPFLSEGSRAAAALIGGKELTILVDRSYSMGYGDHWKRAVAAAHGAIDGMGPGDRATVIFFADQAQAANRTTDDPVALKAAVDSAKPGSGITRYGGALKLARQFLEESHLPRREAVIISDFQRAGRAAEELTRLPAGTDVRTVSVAERDPANVSVSGVSFQRDVQDGRERVLVSARLSNRGAKAVARVPVTLEVGGRELQRRAVDLAANGAGGVAFTPFNLPDGQSRGTVRLGADNLPADNVFHFVLAPEQAVSVLLLEPVGASPELSLYLRRALAVGDRPPFRVESRRANQLTRSDLSGRSIVMSLDAGIPAGDAGRALFEFVNAGGGLVVALGERSTAAAFGPEAAALMPGRVGAVVDRPTTTGGRLGQLDVSHPVFEPFSAPRSGDFSSARFFRYRKVETVDTAGTRPAVLARFDDGTPALIERRVGRGSVLVWTSSLDNFWSDLPLQPVYLPFVHQLAKRGAGYAEAEPWFSVGQAVDLADRRVGGPVDAASDREQLVAQTPGGGHVVIPAGTSRALQLREQGFYEVRRPGDRPGTARVVAANLDLAESDLTALDPQEFAAVVRPAAPGSAGGGPGETVSAEDRERRQAIWWYLLVGASLLLTAETLLSNRLSLARASN